VTLALAMVVSLGLLLAQSPEAGQMTLTLLNDDFLKWAFRGLIVAACGYLYREHGRQRRQDEAILRLEHAMNLNHPSRADFETYRMRQEQILTDMRDDMQTMDRILRLLAAKMNVDVRT